MAAAGTAAVDEVRAEFARDVVKILEGIDGETFGALEYRAALTRLDGVLDAFYGRWPGDEEGRFLRVIVATCRMARERAVEEDAAATRRLVTRHRARLRALADG